MSKVRNQCSSGEKPFAVTNSSWASYEIDKRYPGSDPERVFAGGGGGEDPLQGLLGLVA